MFDHVTIRASDRSASERFYRTTLGELGVEPTHADPHALAWNDFSIVAGDDEHPPTRHLHLAFVAPTREHVAAFWRAGLSVGGEDDGAPGERPQYTDGYYGAFVRDPDGNSAEAVIHNDVRRGGNIDHLWIRVRDLDAASAFYAIVARHTGLREGRRWNQGRQFRGAWATFSLVADGSPPTENLQIAFPAADKRTVEDFHRAATAAGYRDAGAPGERPCDDRGYPARAEPDSYSACVLDPDGIRVESIFRRQS
jgi:catechol 2,3-dioxygenase-like lactoylglutathione lyase family enzyme